MSGAPARGPCTWVQGHMLAVRASSARHACSMRFRKAPGTWGHGGHGRCPGLRRRRARHATNACSRKLGYTVASYYLVLS